MKKTIQSLSLLCASALVAVAMATPAAAQSNALRVATGKKGDTYSMMLGQLAQQCSASASVAEINTNGSNDNINLLVGNEVNAALLQTDVLWLRARTEDLNNVKTLLALHPEQVHVVAMATAGRKEGGVLGMGGKVVHLKDVTSLVGRRVGAAGGSLTTAQVIRLQSEIQYEVIPFETGDAAMSALQKGEIDAVFLVGGAPLGSVARLGPNFKLLAFPEAVAAKLKSVYRPARLNYQRMGAAGISTVATEAVLVTRTYKSQRMTSNLTALRQCAARSMDDLKETLGTHPAWQNVDPANKGKWHWLDLPAAGNANTGS